MTDRFEVCPTADLPPGSRCIIEPKGFSIGVFNIDGEYYALKNDCPHQHAPLCEGLLTGTTTADGVGRYNWERPGQIVRCPWHGWEFDVTTGESVFNPHKVKAMTFQTEVEPAEGAHCSNCGGGAASDTPVETYDVEIAEGTVYIHV